MSMFIHINLLDEGTVVPGVNLIVFLFLLINKTTCFLWERRKKFILRQHKYRNHNSLKEEQVWSTSAHMSVWRHIPFLSRKFRKHFPTQAPPTGSQSESDLSRAGAGLEKHGNIHSVRWITVTLMSQFSIIHCSHMETATQLFWQSNNKNRTQRIQKKIDTRDTTDMTWLLIFDCDALPPSGGHSPLPCVAQRPLLAWAFYQLRRCGPRLCAAELCLPEHKHTLYNLRASKETIKHP